MEKSGWISENAKIQTSLQHDLDLGVEPTIDEGFTNQ